MEQLLLPDRHIFVLELHGLVRDPIFDPVVLVLFSD